MNKFKKRELSEAFFTSVLINIFEKFKKTKYYEEYDRKGEFTYSYEIRCKDDFFIASKNDEDFVLLMRQK